MISLRRGNADCGAAAPEIARLHHQGGVPRRACFCPDCQPVSTVMDLPSSRELELEALLRNKDSQLAELTVRTLVRHFISFSLGVTPGRGQHPPPVSLDSAQSFTHRAFVSAARTYISAPHPYR
jgi:hypothetical protein